MAEPITRTYDPKRLAISFTTIIAPVIFTGFPDGDFLVVTAPDSFEGEDGADGTHDRVNLNNNTLDIEITVKKTSLVNDILTTIHTTDKLSNTGVGTLLIVDTNGTMFISSPQAYITKYSDITLGKGIAATTWFFKAPNAVYNVGSNF